MVHMKRSDRNVSTNMIPCFHPARKAEEKTRNHVPLWISPVIWPMSMQIEEIPEAGKP
jgi:hypothetical protein